MKRTPWAPGPQVLISSIYTWRALSFIPLLLFLVASASSSSLVATSSFLAWVSRTICFLATLVFSRVTLCNTRQHVYFPSCPSRLAGLSLPRLRLSPRPTPKLQSPHGDHRMDLHRLLQGCPRRTSPQRQLPLQRHHDRPNLCHLLCSQQIPRLRS